MTIWFLATVFVVIFFKTMYNKTLLSDLHLIFVISGICGISVSIISLGLQLSLDLDNSGYH